MVIGCMRVTDVTRYEERYDSDRAMDVVKNWGWAACAEHTAQGKNYELILTVKMETRHPVDAGT